MHTIMYIYIYIYTLQADRPTVSCPQHCSVIACQRPHLAALLYKHVYDVQWRGPFPWHSTEIATRYLSATVPTIAAITPTTTADALFCGCVTVSTKNED